MRRVIKEGTVEKVEPSYDRNAVPPAVKLILYSDATLEIHQEHKAAETLKIKPFLMVEKSQNVLSILEAGKVYGGGLFRIKNAQERERWRHMINYIRLCNDDILHIHPLEEKVPIKDLEHVKYLIFCQFCQTRADLGALCRYCNYNVCATCFSFSLALKITNSKFHEHKLVIIDQRTGHFFSSKAGSPVKCNICSDMSIKVAHCVECDYYECQKCHDTSTALGSEACQTSKMDLKQLEDYFITSNIDGRYCYTMKEYAGRLFSVASVIADRHLDLSKIETEAPSHAYFEVIFDGVNKDEVIGVGISPQRFVQSRALGRNKNFGYFSDGSVQYNVNFKHDAFLEGFEPGDTIGLGVTLDDWNTRRIYITKNGSLVGYFPEKASLNKEKNYYPGVSFTRNSQVSFSVNFTSPFKFDLRSIPDYTKNEKIDRINQLPKELIILCIAHAADDSEDARKFHEVSKSWSALCKDNVIWKNLFLRRWPHQNPNLKLGSWYLFYKKRHMLIEDDKIKF